MGARSKPRNQHRRATLPVELGPVYADPGWDGDPASAAELDLPGWQGSPATLGLATKAATIATALRNSGNRSSYSTRPDDENAHAAPRYVR